MVITKDSPFWSVSYLCPYFWLLYFVFHFPKLFLYWLDHLSKWLSSHWLSTSLSQSPNKYLPKLCYMWLVWRRVFLFIAANRFIFWTFLICLPYLVVLDCCAYACHLFLESTNWEMIILLCVFSINKPVILCMTFAI